MSRPPGASGAEVELVFNCFERTIGRAVHPGVLSGLADAHGYPFASRTLLVNNVDDLDRWRPSLDGLVEVGAVDRWVAVADALPAALAVTGLSRRDIEARQHWSDFGLVAVSLPGPDWVCYCDPEITLPEPGDWIGPAIALMEADGRVAVANPRWTTGTAAEDKADEVSGDFFLGYGFTDQIFLTRRSELARPIYRSALPVVLRSPASLRYPASFDSTVFEMRVDAYMRAHGRLRATHRHIRYDHAPEEGSSYRARTVAQKVRRLRNHALLKVLVEARFRSPRLRVDGLLAR